MSSSALPFAYSTMLLFGDGYVPGALVLGWSLRECGTTAKLVIMVTSEISEEAKTALRVVWDDVRVIPYIEAIPIMRKWTRFGNVYDWISKSFTKINVLGLKEYSKIVLFDADMLAVANPDELFSVPSPAGICSAIKNDDEMHLQPISDDVLEDSLVHGYGIRGCCYVLTPNEEDFSQMKKRLDGGSYGRPDSFCGPDEQLFTDHYKGKWVHIHRRFGCAAWKTNELSVGVKPTVLHFVTEKPWSSLADWPDFKIWNDCAEKLRKAHPEVSSFLPTAEERRKKAAERESSLETEKRDRETKKREKSAEDVKGSERKKRDREDVKSRKVDEDGRKTNADSEAKSANRRDESYEHEEHRRHHEEHRHHHGDRRLEGDDVEGRHHHRHHHADET